MHLLKLFKLSDRKTEVVLFFMVLLSFGLLILAIASKNSVPSTSENGDITHSTDNPDESIENARNYKWQGGPEDPKRIVIEKIQVDSLIQRVGVDQHNKVAVPSNVHLAAWFTESVQPGKTGLSVIDAHVSGRSMDGLFKNLNQLTTGDEFRVERGDGKVLRYRVMETKTVLESESAEILFSQNSKTKSQLNLITCSGSFDRQNNQYTDRTIVSGELLE